MNPAFELIRKHKPCNDDTEELVMKRIRGKISAVDLITAFENGLAGDYGTLYKADPQTLIDWVDQFLSKRNSAKNYLGAPLLSPNISITHPLYPTTIDEWHKEINKCYTCFLNGVTEDNFHPDCYSRLTMDSRIEFYSCDKYYQKSNKTDNDFKVAKQLSLRDYFLTCKAKGWTFIYFIEQKN